MATIPTVSNSATSEITSITEVELTGTDTIAQKTGGLVVDNSSASPVTLNLLGDEATTYYDSDLGTVDVSGGYDFQIPAGEKAKLSLNRIQPWLAGTVSVTGGATDVFAYIEA